MKTGRFTLPPLSGASFCVSHVDIDARSPLNQSESHIHEECEIYLNLSGDVSFEVENRIYPISRGSVIITRPYEYHHCIYHSEQPHEHYWITFSPEERDGFLRMFFTREKGRDNLIRLDSHQLERACRVLEALTDGSSDALELRIQSLELFRILSEGKREGPVTQGQNLPEAVARAVAYMDAHLSEDLSAGRLAAAANVSVNTLERQFKDALAMTPFAMLRKKRLVASMEALRSGESVTDAALKSGFSDYSHYIQLFRRQFGITPFQYKKKYLAE